MRIIGIDEAGRGAVIGSLFVAGVVNFEGLDAIGVRDSKRLSPKRREELAAIIEGTTDVHVIELTAREIDERRKWQSMNEITVELFSHIIELLQPDRVYVDAADVKPARFASRIMKRCDRDDIEIISEFKADTNYPVVSAASIMAKVYRDRSIRALSAEIGVEIGSGYPSDPRTIRFLKRILNEQQNHIPVYVRRSWKTIEKLK